MNVELSLLNLRLNKKEIKVYLYLVEYWESPASIISKHLDIPKSTINFISDNLWRKWILSKSFKWNTWYFEADISKLEEYIINDIAEKKDIKEYLIPILKEKNKNVISRPKISFIDWVENCKKEYLRLLNTDTKIFYEYWAHYDLEKAFWKWFMNYFIKERVKKDIFCDSIWSNWKVEIELHKLDKVHNRALKIFEKEIFWEINSSIAIYDDKVLILNLSWINTWVLIENKEFAKTMKTIFMICKSSEQYL